MLISLAHIAVHYIKTISLIVIVFCWTIWAGCKQEKQQDSPKNEIRKSIDPSLLDSAGVKGSIIIMDATDSIYYSTDYIDSEYGSIPASTFKIPNTIIGLELGIIPDENHIFKWDGTSRAMRIWEEDLTLREAFQRSCVPCYQELAREIGAIRMNYKVNELDYGHMVIDEETLDRFWLTGPSAISPMEQVDFLRRMYFGQLPIRDQTTEIIKDIMLIDSLPTFQLYGKTGLAVRDTADTGWFVGYLETKDKLAFFATRITPSGTMERSELIPLRKEITIQALREVGLIEE